MTNDRWILLARLVRPQGRRGEVLADLLTDFPERFSERKRLFLLPAATTKKPAEPREMELEEHWLHKGRVVLKFAGIDSITDAETLRGMEVAIPHEERAPLAGDEVYVSELIGCRVFAGGALAGAAMTAAPMTGALEDVGEITDVDFDSTAMPLLVVKRLRGDEVLIPFAKAFLQRLDVAAKRVEMTLPAGLLEVNSPLTDAERQTQQQESAAESDREPGS